MDIDGLKRINDAHGHASGDRILIQVGVAIRRSIRTVDTPARLGGDEFCVLAPNQDASQGGTLGSRLAAAVQEGVAVPDGPPVGLSIGVVSCPEHGDDADALMDLADRAMYQAKAAGEGVAIGDPERVTAVENSSR
jgi:diguanylate cyclase (GGDEF)-like protein